MVRFYKGGVRDLSTGQLALLAEVLERCRMGRASAEAARLGYGDNLDEADLERQLETIGIERCPYCGAWVRSEDIIAEDDALIYCQECAKESDNV